MMQQGLYGNNDLRKKIEDYSYGLKDVIGRGFSSVVYRGVNDKTKEKVAIKVIDIRAIQGKPEKRMLEGEIDALKKLNHPNILKCHDIFSTANNCYIITEFCNEGDLENLLKKREKLQEEEAIPLIRELLMGFIFIAENGFLHRDLKPANILLKDKIVKIADFGFAKRATSNPKESVNVGSPLYMSP
jgi:serine/threonine-protein kinase ULK/ATG1